MTPSPAAPPSNPLEQSDSLAFEPGGLSGPRGSLGAGALINQPTAVASAGAAGNTTTPSTASPPAEQKLSPNHIKQDSQASSAYFLEWSVG